MISDDSYNWYTTNYRHTAGYATLIVKATVYNKPFTLNWSSVDFIFKISGTISYFPGRWDKVSKSGTVPANPGHMACMTLNRITLSKKKKNSQILGKLCYLFRGYILTGILLFILETVYCNKSFNFE